MNTFLDWVPKSTGGLRIAGPPHTPHPLSSAPGGLPGSVNPTVTLADVVALYASIPFTVETPHDG